MLKKLLSAVLLLGLVSPGFSQAVGKLSGVVKDKESGEPLPGVNVVIQETFLGASTDVDGFFVVLNVPAGTYTVAFDYIGYQPVNIENVRVVADITKRLDVELQPTTIELDEAVIVIAEKPFFEASATNTVRVMDADEIARTPIKGVNSIVAMNSGVVAADGSGGATDNATVNVRGGRGNETLFVVDGIPYNDILVGNVTGTIPDAAIEQISSQLGGFSAKYGSAQSGVVNITTKGGSTRYFGGLDLITSNLTDPYNYNSYTGFLGGPLVPGSKRYSFFGTLEYIKTDDERPRSSGLVIPSAGIDQKKLNNAGAESIRFTGKLDGKFGNFTALASVNGSFRDARQTGGTNATSVHTYSKNNSEHYPKIKEDVYGGSVKLSHVLNPTTFWDLTMRGKYTNYKRGDGVWFDNLEAYGDAAANAAIGVILPQGDGSRVTTDTTGGVFYARGRVFDLWQKYEITTGGADLNFTKQFRNHLVEIGATYEQSQIRYYTLFPIDIADDRTLPDNVRYGSNVGVFYGYSVTGEPINDSRFVDIGGDEIEEAAPKKPVIAGAYIQDKIEFQDFILNLGARWDYFDAATTRFKDPNNIYGFGPNPNRLDQEDLEPTPAESYLSPRLGFAFPVTQFTVFHAAYGVFRQAPQLFDLYDSWNQLQIMEQRDGQGQNNGWLKMEKTTSYEFGFKQQIGNVASLDVTAYYRNVQGLVNVKTISTVFGQSFRKYISSVNQDFGTIKGLTFNFTLRRMGPFSTRVDYTLSLSEGTGSDPTSSRIATFRNPANEIPLAIAPLDFDERHNLKINLDIRAGLGEGPTIFNTKLLEEAGANFEVIYTSGRPYTPLATVDVLTDNSQYGNVTQYVNSALAEGVFRIDMKIDKNIRLGKNISLTPYFWVINLLDRENFNQVWQSTGKPDDTGYLRTPEGEALIASREPSRPDFVSDYKALERDPWNYGLPRLVRLGLKLKF